MAKFSVWLSPLALGAVAITSPSQAAVSTTVGLSRPPVVLVMDDMMGGMRGQGMQGQGMQGQSMQGQGSAGCGPGQPGCGAAPGGTPMQGMGMQDRMSTMERQRMGMGMGPGMAGQTLGRLDGRLAFLHAELHITQQQMPAWDAFAASLRSARDHLAAARTAMQDGNKATDPLGRLEAYERHSAARLQALHDSRVAFAKLYGTLDDEQKRTADELVVPLLASL
ncbi:Spy/CpxP family protein refolding chaperone [Roseicella frigidaeris]|nr:Spy/CpxP family protein refolding chaperone [Roseicella frigidaeris]